MFKFKLPTRDDEHTFSFSHNFEGLFKGGVVDVVFKRVFWYFFSSNVFKR